MRQHRSGEWEEGPGRAWLGCYAPETRRYAILLLGLDRYTLLQTAVELAGARPRSMTTEATEADSHETTRTPSIQRERRRSGRRRQRAWPDAGTGNLARTVGHGRRGGRFSSALRRHQQELRRHFGPLRGQPVGAARGVCLDHRPEWMRQEHLAQPLFRPHHGRRRDNPFPGQPPNPDQHQGRVRPPGRHAVSLADGPGECRALAGDKAGLEEGTGEARRNVDVDGWP